VATDGFVSHASELPNHVGASFRIAVRDVVREDRRRCGSAEPVVLVHGATLPGIALYAPPVPELDLPAALAREGFHVFTLDLPGYGRSQWPVELDDPCNLPARERAALGLTCTPSYPFQASTSGAERAALHAVVAFAKRTTGAEKVHLLGGSLGAFRVLHYARTHPNEVARLVLLAAGGSGALTPSAPPRTLPAPGAPMTAVTRAEFDERFDLGTTCAPERLRRDALTAAFEAALASDPRGAAWGLVRAATTTQWGTSTADLAAISAPALLVAGTCDGLVPDDAASRLYEALGSAEKVRVVLEAAGHGMLLENGAPRVHALVAEWLRGGVDQRSRGVLVVDAAGARRWR